MALRVIQPGSGSPRPLVLVYLQPLGSESAFNLDSNVAIVADKEAGQNDYPNVQPLNVTLDTLSQQLGATFSPVILAGFSAGGLSVRHLLNLGADPDAVVLADGTYGTDLAAWTAYAQKAIAGKRVFVASYSSNVFMEPAHPSPWRNMRTITGFNTLPLGPSASPMPAGAPVTQKPVFTESGNAIVYSYPDLDHESQGRKVLPTVLVPKAFDLLGTPESPPSTSYWWFALAGSIAGLAGFWWWDQLHKTKRLEPAYAEPNPLDDVGLGQAEEAGIVFKTCVPVTFRYVHNTDPAPHGESSLYSQDVEPAGVYMIHVPGDSTPPSGWIAGTMHFDCPLVLELNLDPELVYGPLDWKQRLHMATRKKRLPLSKHLLKLGYDGIVTVRGNETSEIVDLRPARTWKRSK